MFKVLVKIYLSYSNTRCFNLSSVEYGDMDYGLIADIYCCLHCFCQIILWTVELHVSLIVEK